MSLCVKTAWAASFGQSIFRANTFYSVCRQPSKPKFSSISSVKSKTTHAGSKNIMDLFIDKIPYEHTQTPQDVRIYKDLYNLQR